MCDGTRHTSCTFNDTLWLGEDSASLSLEFLNQLPGLLRVLVVVDSRDI
jgi:hypothetical protein